MRGVWPALPALLPPSHGLSRSKNGRMDILFDRRFTPLDLEVKEDERGVGERDEVESGVVQHFKDDGAAFG